VQSRCRTGSRCRLRLVDLKAARLSRQAKPKRGTQLCSWVIDRVYGPFGRDRSEDRTCASRFDSDILRRDRSVGCHVAGIRPRIEYNRIRYTSASYVTGSCRC
jgi:hypothetical protein